METYITNSDFKRYVDRYCTQNHKTVAEALKDKIVKGVENYYKDKSSRAAEYSKHFMNKFMEVQ